MEGVKAIKFAGLVWGILYFGFGVVSSFTLNSVDFASSIALLAFTFIFPLPFSVVAFWYPKVIGIALSLSIILCVAVLVSSDGLKDTLTASPGIRFYIPHALFAVAYLILASASKNLEPGSET